MKNLNIPLIGTLLLLSLIVCPILYFHVGPELNTAQLAVLKILLIVAGSSTLFCFVVGELSGNNSQVDKVWSLLPIVYCWIVAAHGGMHPRLVMMAALVSLWGLRLTFNFARKGAYRLKFWEGEEDYRWKMLRETPVLKHRAVWMVFDLVFISGYQNALILLFTLPVLVCMGATAPLDIMDIVAAALMLFFIVYETIADEQQWKFQSRKWAMINGGKRLEELPAPYNKGFNTQGLWSRSRHPNYMAEQAIWICLYLFSIAAGDRLFNWSMIGALLLVVLFVASTSLSEGISGDKYPEYGRYCKQVSKYFPGKKYRDL